MSRSAIAIWLPPDELVPVTNELAAAGFETIALQEPADLEIALETRRDVSLAVLDGENDFDRSLAFFELLRDGKHDLPVLMVVSERALERFVGSPANGSIHDEFMTRPYAVESIRWRIEAMLIRSQTVDDGSGDVLQTGTVDTGDWGPRATVVAIFNPKGGVGKTTIATNLAAALQIRKGQRVLLVDADTVTGHVATSLGLEQVRTVVDSWREEAEDGVVEGFLEIASAHPSGMRVIALTTSPLDADGLAPDRVADAISVARREFDFIVVDTHPSYGALNMAIFDRADRIITPVTPDLPAIRAAVQLGDLATKLGIRDRISMVVNRANSGVSVADMERTVALPALALIRSGGLLFVRAANEGKTVIERFPKERVSEDFDQLADKLLPSIRATAGETKPALKSLFGRRELAAGA